MPSKFKPPYQPGPLLQAALGFYKANNLCWKIRENPENPEYSHFLAKEVEPDQAQEILLIFAHVDGPVSELSTMRLATKTPKSEETLLAFCAFLLFGDYGTLLTEEKAPIFLEEIEATKAVFSEHRYIQTQEKITNGVFSALTNGLAHSKKVAAQITRQERERIENSPQDQEGEDWKN